MIRADIINKYEKLRADAKGCVFVEIEKNKRKETPSGELAIKQFYNIEFANRTIQSSNDLNYPILNSVGLNCGIITSEYGVFPMVSTDPKIPQIIVAKLTDLKYLILGIATPEMLKRYSDKDFLLNNKMKNNTIDNNNITAFYGFDHLIQTPLDFYNLKKTVKNLEN